jgi:hypothetical protein
MGSYAMIFLGGAIVLDEVDGPPWIAATLAIIVIVATVALARPIPVFLPANVAAQLRQVARPASSCPPGTQEFDRACFIPSDAQLLRSVSGFVDSHAAPNSPLAVFPYQTAFGVASRRGVANGVLQSYLINGGYLTGLEIAALERSRPGTALYLPDHLLSDAVDGVPNFTRSPDVWFYYVRHYRAAGNPLPGVLGLSWTTLATPAFDSPPRLWGTRRRPFESQSGAPRSTSAPYDGHPAEPTSSSCGSGWTIPFGGVCASHLA